MRAANWCILLAVSTFCWLLYCGSVEGLDTQAVTSVQALALRDCQCLSVASVRGESDQLSLQASEWPIIFTRRDEGTPPFDIVAEPIPAECNVQPNTDYDGSAIRWGHRPAPPVKSAAECCRMCLDWVPRLGKTCDAWVFCADPSGACWAPDIWPHETGECWLKYQGDWNGDPAKLVENARGDYPAEWLQMHTTSPLKVPWTAGYRTA